MRKVAIAIALASLLIYVPGSFATGGSQTFRVITTGDAYMLALSSSCPAAVGDPTVDPECFLVKDTLGYDGETGGSTTATSAHVNHAFECVVSASATGVVGNALPFPANMAISDSIVVGFDLNGDNSADVSYGGRIKRPPIGAVQNRINGAVATQDVGTLADTPSWYLSNFALNGATPVVSGNTDGAGLIIWNQGGSDVTIDCTF